MDKVVIYIFIAHSVEFYCVEFYSYDKQQVCVVLLCDHKQEAIPSLENFTEFVMQIIAVILYNIRIKFNIIKFDTSLCNPICDRKQLQAFQFSCLLCTA